MACRLARHCFYYHVLKAEKIPDGARNFFMNNLAEMVQQAQSSPLHLDILRKNDMSLRQPVAHRCPEIKKTTQHRGSSDKQVQI